MRNKFIVGHIITLRPVGAISATALLLVVHLLSPVQPLCSRAIAAGNDEEYIPGESVAAQHAKDKRQLQKAKDELQDIKTQMNNAATSAQQLQQQLLQQQQLQTQAAVQQQVKQFDLTTRECSYEFAPGMYVDCLGYNAQVPGPTLHVTEGDPVRLVVHNKMDVPTSLYLQGMSLPYSVGGLPRSSAGLIAPGQTYTFQFMAPRAGTYWYHPQILHGDQQDRGLFGALIVDPKESTNPIDLDQVMVLSKWVVTSAGSVGSAGSAATRLAAKPRIKSHLKALCQKDAPFPSTSMTYFMVNGKCAPFIPALEVTPGTRVRLRAINTTSDTIPLTLTGHQLLEFSDFFSPPKPPSDVVVVGPGTTVNVEFSCDNPGVWSLGSTVPSQNESKGIFPGGIARAIRYEGFTP